MVVQEENELIIGDEGRSYGRIDLAFPEAL